MPFGSGVRVAQHPPCALSSIHHPRDMVFNMLERRAEPIDFNVTSAHPAFAHLNASSIAVLQAEADRLASPVQVDGFSVSILVAVFGIYMLSLLCIGFMRTFFRSRFLALASHTQRQCGGFLASAITMSAPVPLQGYALSAAKWDITSRQIEFVRIAAIIVCAFCLFDIIHRDRFVLLIVLQRAIALGAITFQIYMLTQVHDPSYIITLVALLFVSITEPPAFFGLFLYKIQCPARWTKFVLRSALPQTIFVKGAGVAIGAYTWTKFQRPDPSALGRASSAVYLASLVGLLTCQILTVLPLHKLAKEIDERYAKKGPLKMVNTKGGKGGRRRRGDRSTESLDSFGHIDGPHGRMPRHANDRLSTFNMKDLHRDSLDEKRRSDDLEIGSSFQSMTPASKQRDLATADRSWVPPNIRERLRSMSPLGRKSPNFSRPMKSNKRPPSQIANPERPFSGSDYSDTYQGAPVSKVSSKGSPPFEATEMRNVPVLNFNAPQGTFHKGEMTPSASTSGRGSVELYSSPPATRRVLEETRAVPSQPQIIVSSASSTGHGPHSDNGSTLNDHAYAAQTSSYQEQQGWSRAAGGSSTANPHSPTYGSSSTVASNAAAAAASTSSTRVPVNRITAFPPHTLGSAMNNTDETSRYALGIVQEYLEPAESPTTSVDYDGYERSGTAQSLRQGGPSVTGPESVTSASAFESAMEEVRDSDATPDLYYHHQYEQYSQQPQEQQQQQQHQQQQHSYTVPRNGARPRQAPQAQSPSPNQQYSVYQYGNQQHQQQQHRAYQQQGGQLYQTQQDYGSASSLPYSSSSSDRPRVNQPPPFLSDL